MIDFYLKLAYKNILYGGVLHFGLYVCPPKW